MSKTAIIRDDFRHAVTSGKFSTGDKIPTQEEIADEYNTDSSTVSRALKPLKDSGLLYVANGGTFVGPEPVPAPIPLHKVPDVITCRKSRCKNVFEVGKWHGVETFMSAVKKAGWTHHSASKIVLFCHQCSKGK